MDSWSAVVSVIFPPCASLGNIKPFTQKDVAILNYLFGMFLDYHLF